MKVNHIYQGDCIDIMKDFEDKSIDLIITDPPYGDNAGYGRLDRKIDNNECPLIGLMAIRDAYRLLKDDACAYFFLDVKHLPFIRSYIEQYTKYTIRDFVIWDKVHFGMGAGFRKQYEMIMVLEKGKPEYKNKGLGNVINVKRVDTTDHPHKKPTELISRLLEQNTDEGDIILDPFAGSGYILKTAKMQGRDYIGIEIDEKYHKLATDYLSQGVLL